MADPRITQIIEALEPFVALFEARDAAYRKRGGDLERFGDRHPAFDIAAEQLRLGAWRNARSALEAARSLQASQASQPTDRVDPTACPECIGMGCPACGGTGDRPKGAVEAATDDTALLTRILRYWEADHISRFGPKGFEESVASGDYPVFTDLRKRLASGHRDARHAAAELVAAAPQQPAQQAPTNKEN
jgi:hypothetical protein